MISCFCRASEVFGSLGSMANSKQEVKYTAGNVEISISIRHLGESQVPEVPSSSDGTLGVDAQMPEIPSSSGGASARDPIPPSLNSDDFDVISEIGKPNDFSPEMFVQVDASLGLFRAGGGSCFHLEKCHHLKRRDVKVKKLKVCKCLREIPIGGEVQSLLYMDYDEVGHSSCVCDSYAYRYARSTSTTKLENYRLRACSQCL